MFHQLTKVSFRSRLPKKVLETVAANRRVCCLDHGICRHELEEIPPLLFSFSFLAHKYMQQVLIGHCGLTAANLKISSIVLVFHGAKPSNAIIGKKKPDIVATVRRFVLIGWQSLKPRATVFIQCEPAKYAGHGLELDERYTRRDSWDYINTSPEFAREALRGLPTHLRVIDPVLLRFNFHRSLSHAASLATLFQQEGYTFDMAVLEHSWCAKNAILLKPTTTSAVKAIWPSTKQSKHAGLAVDPLQAVTNHSDGDMDLGEDVAIHHDEIADEFLMKEIGQENGEYLALELEAMKRLEQVQKAIRTKPGDKPADDIVVEKGRSHWTVWKQNRVLGKLTFPIHWEPPCVCAVCFHPSHSTDGNPCMLALKISDENEDALVHWLSSQDNFLSKLSHRHSGPTPAKKID